MILIEISHARVRVKENLNCIYGKTKKRLLQSMEQAFLAVCTGLEPVTSCVTGRHSNQLN